MQVAKEFSLSFDGIGDKVGNLQFQVSKDTIVAATKIHVHGEQWFKGMQLDLSYYHEFLKHEFRNTYFGATIPRELLLESHRNLLRVIQRFFICEGGFTRVYQYHIRLLMHFTYKKHLNIPYYIFRSLGKMAAIVQVRRYQGEPGLFHFSLIKMLVLEDLRKRNLDWEVFVASSKIADDSLNNPQSMRDTPSLVENTTTSVHQCSVKKREKETDEPTISEQAKKKGKKIQFSPEEVISPSKPVTRLVAKEIPTMHSSQKHEEDPKAFIEEDYPSDKDNLIIELQEQLRKSHIVIVQLQHENREMKKKDLEQASKNDISVTDETSIPVTTTRSKTKCKGKTME
jgi:hypothetical protein